MIWNPGYHFYAMEAKSSSKGRKISAKGNAVLFLLCCVMASSSARNMFIEEEMEANLVPDEATLKYIPDSPPTEKYRDFFVITTVFNPASFQRRYTLYNNFVEHMRVTGAQLITVECIFPSLNQTFQVTNADNPYHIQLESKSVHWLKENLINIAVSRLPPHAKWISWLDADISFQELNWIELTIEQLQKYVVVQVFKQAKFLGPPPRNTILRTDYSFGYSILRGNAFEEQQTSDEWYPHPGYGWAMSLDAFKKMGGLPEFDLMGSGDLHFAVLLVNAVSNAIGTKLNPAFVQVISENSQRTYKKLVEISKMESKFLFGYVPVTINHHWHGSRKDRQYDDRWDILTSHDFDFLEDTQRNEEGLLQLTPNKPLFQKAIMKYFEKRQEDSNGYWDDLLVNLKRKRTRREATTSDNGSSTGNKGVNFVCKDGNSNDDNSGCRDIELGSGFTYDRDVDIFEGSAFGITYLEKDEDTEIPEKDKDEDTEIPEKDKDEDTEIPEKDNDENTEIPEKDKDENTEIPEKDKDADSVKSDQVTPLIDPIKEDQIPKDANELI